MQNLNGLHPLVVDIQKRYMDYRMTGKNRKDAIAAIRADYFQELQDIDDCVWVLIGLSLSLSKKKELTAKIANETKSAITMFRQHLKLDNAVCNYLLEIEQLLANKSIYGKEAVYRCRTQYVPDWKIGDVLAHTLTYPKADDIGILGWTILFYKVGEYIDDFNKHHELMFISLCPPGKEPTCSAELQALGFLRMMPHDKKWDYLVQLSPKSKKDELNYEFTSIGNFPEVLPPCDQADENPLVSMPMFGRLRMNDMRPAYEDQICRLYKKYGKKV